jgi:predicted RNA binding protein YcfA (HicA-like mRNA interferase family)
VGRLPQVLPERLIRALGRIGFVVFRQRGSHVTLRHPDGRLVIVPLHNFPLKKGMLTGILRQIALTADELRELL